MPSFIDEMDAKILRTLMEDGRTPFSHMAKELGVSDVAVKKRVEKLLQKGIIRRIKAEVNLEAIGYKYVFFVEVKPDPAEVNRLARRIYELPNVVEVHMAVGEYPIIVKALATDISDIKKFLEKLGKMEGVLEIRTAISLASLHKDPDITRLFQRRLLP